MKKTLRRIKDMIYRTAVLRGEAAPGDHRVGTDVVHGTLYLDQAHINTKLLCDDLLHLNKVKYLSFYILNEVVSL